MSGLLYTAPRFFELASGETVEVFIPKYQAGRLKNTCFRGERVKRAGNFFRWNTFLDFLMDAQARALLTLELETICSLPRERDYRLELGFDEVVGWDSVLDDKHDGLEPVDTANCEYRALGTRSRGMFFPHNQIKAPLTADVTMVLSETPNPSLRQFKVETMYPGADCGRLEGDMTHDHGFYFLDWENEGE